MFTPEYLPEEDYQAEQDNHYGLSVGDLMSALLLMFVLLLTYALLQLHKSYQDQIKIVGIHSPPPLENSLKWFNLKSA